MNPDQRRPNQDSGARERPLEDQDPSRTSDHDFGDGEARTEVRRNEFRPSARGDGEGRSEVTEIEEIEAEELEDRPTDRPASSAEEERWQQILAEFVDNPRGSVAAAHELVGQSVQSIIDRLNEERASLEQQWSGGRDTSTETLRLCLQRYRAFFNRLLSQRTPADTDGAAAPTPIADRH
jgi:hypothetical protein